MTSCLRTTDDPRARARRHRNATQTLAAIYDWVTAAWVIAGVLIGNVLFVDGLSVFNPIATDSGLATVTQWSWLKGPPSTDPNVGLTSQALGHLAADMLVHGHLPYWNIFEGVGTPLLEEMQSAALFPFTLLQLLANGALWEHVSMELSAGLLTMVLLRYIGLGRLAAAMAGIGFGLNGTYAWLTNAAANPIVTLPLVLLGAEIAVRAAAKHRRGGWILLALALVVTLAAGFPEVATFDTILVALWVVARLVTTGERRQLFVKLSVGSVAGLLMSAPILIAMLDDLHASGTGSHTGNQLGHVSLVASLRPLLLNPYAYGIIWRHAWALGMAVKHLGGVAGYLSAGTVVLAIAGLWGTSNRALRIALGVWVAMSVLATWGFLYAHQVFDLIPGVARMALTRYIPPSMEFAVVVLAAFALDDLVRDVMKVRVAVLSGLAGVSAVAWSTYAAMPQHHRLEPVATSSHLLEAMLWVPLVSAVAVAILLFIGRTKFVYVALVLVVSAEVMLNFIVPSGSAPRHYTVDTPAITYLQSHAGTYRTYGLDGPLQPNYGSYFAIPEINVNDLPVPSLFITYVPAFLDNNTNAYFFTGTKRSIATGPSARDAFLVHLAGYERSSVKYVMMPVAEWNLRRFDEALGLRFVYRDSTFAILELPHVSPMFSARGCTTTSTNVNGVTVDCQHPSTLIRRELFMPGWSVVDGHAALVVRAWHKIFEAVHVPAGISTLRFSFTPPHEGQGWDACFAGLMLCFGGSIATRYRPRRRAATRRA